MTVINRALHKAYKRRAETEPAPEPTRHSSATDTGLAGDTSSANGGATATVSGWASKLREPIRTLNRPTVAIEAALATAPPVIMAHALPEGAIIRVDAAHTAVESSTETSTDSEPAHPVVDDHSKPLGQPEPAGQTEPPGQWSWPPIVQRLLTCSAAPELCDLAVQLRELAAGHDLRCVAFSGPARQAGRTSLMLTLASVLIADKTTSVAIVDADFSHPHAAQLISLQPAAGLEEALHNLAIDDQVVTTLIPDRLAIVPLAKPMAAETIDNRRLGALQTFLRSLRREYDLVLIDAGPWEAAHLPLVLECRAVDAVVCICRANSSHEETAGAANFLQPGVEWLGTIETFAPLEKPAEKPLEERARQTA